MCPTAWRRQSAPRRRPARGPPAQPDFPALEREVLEYWEAGDTFRESIRRRPADDEFVFYDKYDSTAYWCVETQRGFGPDGLPVRPDCCTGERDCCKH